MNRFLQICDNFHVTITACAYHICDISFRLLLLLLLLQVCHLPAPEEAENQVDPVLPPLEDHQPGRATRDGGDDPRLRAQPGQRRRPLHDPSELGRRRHRVPEQRGREKVLVIQSPDREDESGQHQDSVHLVHRHAGFHSSFPARLADGADDRADECCRFLHTLRLQRRQSFNLCFPQPEFQNGAAPNLPM